MFIGEYSHTLDAKGRIIIPSKFRDELHSTFYLTRGIDNCLTIYSLEEWNKLLVEIKKLPATKKAVRQYTHMLTSRACECTVDTHGRIAIPTYLSKEVNITKDCVIVGVNDRVEIWDKDTWNNYYDEASANFEEVAENLSDLLNND